MFIAGLTGGTGSGKSTAARRFETHGIAIVDADREGHALIESGGGAEAAVVDRFGPSILTDGVIDRRKLGALVFSNPTALAALNAIMKPRIAEAIALRCATLAAAGKPATLVDAALLGDSGAMEPWLEGLVLVSSPMELRVQRLVETRELTEVQARERITAQVDPEQKRSFARWIIENDGSLGDLHDRVDEIAVEILSLAGCPDG